jgi:hypothetical protein
MLDSPTVQVTNTPNEVVDGIGQSFDGTSIDGREVEGFKAIVNLGEPSGNIWGDKRGSSWGKGRFSVSQHDSDGSPLVASDDQ